MEVTIIDKVNTFTRRAFTEDEIFIFDVILCDNEIDRDCERFSHEALVQLKKLFVGKTGISDHNPKAQNQLARIFETELVTDDARTTSYGQPYEYVKASAYMVRTDTNADIIAEIEGGIKKEVSISCAAKSRKCSVCGTDKNVSGCTHVKGKSYSKAVCHGILGDIGDAYEWSFVAIPAQVNAGVTKHFTDETEVLNSSAPAVTAEVIAKANADIKRDIIRLAYIAGGAAASKTAALTASLMRTAELLNYKALLAKSAAAAPKSQLFKSADKVDDCAEFSMR